MAKEAFIYRDFKEGSFAIIRAANEIISEYRAMGFTLTLRQLYYQFVSRDLLPNKQSEYKRLGSIINDARLAGYIDWSAIEDRTRNLRKPAAWNSPEEILRAVAQQYQEDLWADQDHYVEVWIEKDALVGVIEPVCTELRVPYFACRGYTSQSEQYNAGKRLARIAGQGRTPVILHLGDHDPSGMDMTRDNGDRLGMFARDEVEVRRLALNWDQIEQYNPPPNPAKETDSRAAGYIDRFGHSSWELDALDPNVISRLIRDEIEGLIDYERWNDARDEEETQRLMLEGVALDWQGVCDFLKRDDEEDK